MPSSFCWIKPGNIGREKLDMFAPVADETAAVHECDAFEPGQFILLANGILSYNWNNLISREGREKLVESVDGEKEGKVHPSLRHLSCDAKQNLKPLEENFATSHCSLV
ncbi:unnamed protein product [Fraxinus pennsylvanica]|uniref:Uncharacterized protein n=1 Tax=Fraxinus pennsylvanica TaxID=56036 RepID=A0AAD1ZZ43_9LAMI|nr:unnamed protein product [Fraxinus pennsylvanica]